ncbi:MAG TPA: glycosyltransferase family 1 protein [Thermomicrobiales bacterium]
MNLVGREASNSSSTRRLRVGLVAYGIDRPFSGIGRYAIQLSDALQRCQHDMEFVLLSPIGQSSAPFNRQLLNRPLKSARKLPLMMTAGPLEVGLQARALRLDVVHDLAGGSFFYLPRQIAPFVRVVTIHDAIPYVYPETHARLTNLLFHQYIPRTLRFVDRIITDSECSKRDIERFFRTGDGMVTTIACGVDQRFRPQPQDRIDEVLGRYGVEPPYLLIVGALQARKNVETALEAFARLKATGMPHRLVVVGKQVWKTEGIFRRLTDLGLEHVTQFTGYVDDEDLPAIYAGAACFLFPSLYEGFGLPPLEAMACGTPVVVSNASSLPEVVGDAGLLVPPRDVDGFADAIRRVIEEPALAMCLRARGLERARMFTWERAAAAHAAIYRQAAAELGRAPATTAHR